MLVESFNTDKNFWTVNPQLEVIFNKIYELDKDKSKELSSTQMWAIAFYTDTSSKWKSLSDKFKRNEIKLDFLDKKIVSLQKKYKDIKSSEEIIIWTDDLIKETIDKYRNYDSSKTGKLLYEWEKKLEERGEFIASKEYSEDTYEMLDKMLAQTNKMWQEYLRIKKDTSSDDADSSAMGGVEESDSEKMLY